MTETMTEDGVRGGYDPRKVPEAPTGSRWAWFSTTPAGWGGSPGEVLVSVTGELLTDRRAEARDHVADTVAVALQAVAVDADDYRLVPRSSVVAVPTHKSARPYKLYKPKGVSEAAIFDSFLLGGLGWQFAPDYQIFNATLAVCELHNVKGNPLRKLNELICVLLLVRAGIGNVDADGLPAIGSTE